MSLIDRQTQIVTDALTEVQDQLDAAGIKTDLDLPHWLTLSMPFARDMIHGQAVRRCAWELLERNGSLIGPARIGLVHAASRPDRRWSVEKIIDLPLDDSSSDALSSRISTAIVDLVLSDAPATAGRSIEREADPNLEELCTAAGLSARRRGDGSVAIALDLPGCAPVNALLKVQPTGEVLASVDLAAVETDDDEECRQAAGLFLLHLAGLARLVRPALCVINSDRPALQLQSYLDHAPTAADLNRAIEALAVAARMSQREIAVLLHDCSIAERWLALRGWSVEAALSA